MRYLSYNPYEGLRCAFISLDPPATDLDFEEWRNENLDNGKEDAKALLLFASACHDCVATRGKMLDVDMMQLICFSAGYFDALLVERFADEKKIM